MSINVTVSGNPISIRGGKMVQLSDLENIKRIDREHRKRLRLEQVKEQSKAIAKNILEKAKRISKEELDRLEKEGNTELHKVYDQKLGEILRRYHEDIENIGYAHENAATQPDTESIKKAEEERNQAIARARGAEATQKLQEQNKIISPKSKHYNRINKVRELEDKRAQMISQLPKKSCAINDNLSHDENVETTSKKTSIARVPKTSFKPKMQHTPSGISVTINGEDVNSSSRMITSPNKSKKSCSTKLPKVPKKVSDITEEGNKYESDFDEPRKTIPVASKSKNFSQTENYEINSFSDLSSNASVSSHTSTESTYTSKHTAFKITPKHYPSPIVSKVSTYDHNTRQRTTYDMPSGVVERLDVQAERNADDVAREIRELKKQELTMLEREKHRERQRCQDAIRREKIRKDYQDLLKKLEELHKEDLKLRAKKISSEDQQVLAPSKTCQKKIKRQKKMDRVFQNIFHNSNAPSSCTYSPRKERPITITPRDQQVKSCKTPITGWKEPPYTDARESDDSLNDSEIHEIKEQITTLMMKIDKKKRKLVQECGDDLPDDIFNTVVRPFNRPNSPLHQERSECHGHSKPKSPEIQVINMSGCGGDKSSQKFICKPKKPSHKTPARTVRRPCSKDTASTCDKHIQVELQEDKSKEKEESIKNPIEPIIKIITPENVDSPSSNSSANTDVEIDVNNRSITIDHKKKENKARIGKESSVTSIKTDNYNAPIKVSFGNINGGKSLAVTSLLIDKREVRLFTEPARKSPEVESKKESPIISSLYHSLPENLHSNSASKKLSKSAPPTRHSSPKKSPARSRASGRPKVGGYSEQRYKARYTQVSIDSSSESFNSTSDTMNGGKTYTRFQALAASRVITTSTTSGNGNNGHRQLQETSDASTTYASPPAAAACAMLKAMNSSTPVLELLDSSSTNEAIRRKACQVSPVSSPETPSPRTMKLPSNIPRPDNRASRNLKLLLDTQMRPTSFKSASKTTAYSLSTNKSSSAKIQTNTPRTSHPCTCNNPMCKLIHDRTEERQTYNLAQCPEALKKLDALQNVYAERIASLTDLIELVRNEPRGFELSVIASENSKLTSRSDATSYPSGSDILMKNMEAIYAQLKKTLEDSRSKIITSEDVELTKSIKNGKKSPITSVNLSKDSVASDSMEDETKEEPAQHATPTGPPKPKIMDNQRVNIPLDRFQHYQKPRSSVTDNKRKLTPSAAASTAAEASATLDQSEQMVKMLSNEILEQSKSVNKQTPVNNLKDSDCSFLKQSQADVKDSGDSIKRTVSTNEQNQSGNLDTSNSDYVPLLAGIPKNARTKNSTNGRARPPVTLISGPYRPEIIYVSPGHELSTIVEFDSPDTANKSQISTRTPSNKARKKLVAPSEAATSPPTSPSKKMDVNVTKSKPSLEVAPFPSHQSPKLSLNISSKSSSKNSDKSPKKSPIRIVDKSPTKSLDKLSKRSIDELFESLDKKKTSKKETEENLSSESMHTLPELHIEQLQQSQDNADGNCDFRVSQLSEFQSLPDETMDQMLISELCEESKSKFSITPERKKIHQQNREKAQEPEQDKDQLTLTSTASLSEVSGVRSISTTSSSDVQQIKCPSSSDEIELALKKWGLSSWIPTVKKTREASALGSSSSSDVTPVNTGPRLVTSVKKETTPHELLAEISDVSSISIKNENKSTERSVLGKAGRTSTPNLLMRSFSNNHSNNSNQNTSKQNVIKNSNNSKHSNHSSRTINSNHSNNSDLESVSLGSFSSDLNIIVENQSAEVSIPNISFSNNNLG